MPRVHVVLDWDGTLTKRDTLHIVSSIGYQLHAADSMSLIPWSRIVQAYIDDYNSHESLYKPPKEQRKTIKDEAAWLSSLSEVENRSVKRVEEAGIFKGVTEMDIRGRAEQAIKNQELELRGGWNDLLFFHVDEPGSSRGTVIHDSIYFTIISVNWSALFIQSCLLEAVAADFERDKPKTAISRDSRMKSILELRILANEVHGITHQELSDFPNSCTSTVEIRTSGDKVTALQRIIQHPEEDSAHPGRFEPTDSDSDSDSDSVIVYVGDSVTDFGALLLADVGVCVRDDPMSGSQKQLAETLERVGISVRPLPELKWRLQARKEATKTVWWSTDLREIAELVSKIVEETQIT
jgi:hypothetical protein